MDFDKLYPHRFLKAGDFGGKDVTLQISGVRLEELDGAKGKETKAVLSFNGTKKELVLNKTNGLCIKAMFGRETDAWLGKRLTFYPAAIQFQDSDLAIRVRGSPDLKSNITFELRLARKTPKAMTLFKTGGQPAAAQPTPPPAQENIDPPGLPDDLPVPQ